MRKYNHLLISLLSIIGLCACGNSTTSGTTYYSAGNDYNYQLSFTESNNIPQTITINVSGSSGVGMPLTQVSPNTYAFGSSQESALLYYNPAESAYLSVAYNGQGTVPYSDFATNTASSNLPNGTFNTICDHSNLSPCQITINNNQISITEYTPQGQSVALCNSSTLSSASSSISPFLQTFICGTNGSTTNSGNWYLVPFTVNGVSGLMINEYNSSSLAADDTTDEIAFPAGSSINPNGSYGYIYNVIQSGQSAVNSAGVSTASLTPTTINNNITGCNNCLLQQNSYYQQPLTGFDYYTTNNSQSFGTTYNVIGNDSMNLYMDSFTGFYLPSN